MDKVYCCSHSFLPPLLLVRFHCGKFDVSFAYGRFKQPEELPITNGADALFSRTTLHYGVMLVCRDGIVTYEFRPRATMLLKAWKILMLALHTVCINGATLPISIALPLNNEYELSNISSGLGRAKLDLNATQLFPNVTAGQNVFSWTHFVAIGVRRTQSLFPGTLPVFIKTYSCDTFDYPKWTYLDCYNITFSGPDPTSSASIRGRWDQVKAHTPYWEVPLRSQGTPSSLPVVPWRPFVALEAAEELAKSMGHTQSYHTVTLEGIQGSRNSFYYKFSSREVQPWHFSFHDVTLGRGGNGTDGLSGS